MRPAPRPTAAPRLLGATIVALLLVQATVLVQRVERAAAPTVAPAAVQTAAAGAITAPRPSVAAQAPVGAAGRLETTAVLAEPPTPAEERFRAAFPAQTDALQDPADPATTRWAVLIGINEHLGSVRDNVGSRQDAEELHQHLLDLGWRPDHMVLLTDTDATRERIVESLRWLADKTDDESVAVVHYSGHSKKWYGQDHDGDGEITDEGLWPTDDGFIPDSELVTLLEPVTARLWLNIGACESAGFNDPGLEREGRLLTFSSTEDRKSYEDPGVQNSVWGYFLIDRALLAGEGDIDGDGEVTVEEAFENARPRARQRTTGQRYGAQDAVMIDHVPGDFRLTIPPPPPPEGQEQEEDEGDGSLVCRLLCERRH